MSRGKPRLHDDIRRAFSAIRASVTFACAAPPGK